MAIKTRKRKAAVRSRKTGVAAIATNRGYTHFKQVFHQDIDNKDCLNIIKGYVRKKFDKARAQAILKNEEWRINKSHVGAYCYWASLEGVEPIAEESHSWMANFFAELAEQGKALVREERAQEKKKAKVYTPSIQERMREQLSDIIGQFEVWLDEQPSKELPKVFEWLKTNSVAQAHIGKIRSYYEPIQAEFKMLTSKNCPEDLAEGYSHLSKADIKQYLAWFDAIFADLDAYANLKRVARKARVKKAPSKEKLISKLKYKKDDSRFKIVSIDPAKILEATELWVFNTKTRKLGKYVAEPNMTLGIKGTTLLCYSEHASLQKTLRKPEEKLKEFNGAGKVALRKFLDDINAVATKMNGRLNADTVLLKVS